MPTNHCRSGSCPPRRLSSPCLGPALRMSPEKVSCDAGSTAPARLSGPTADRRRHRAASVGARRPRLRRGSYAGSRHTQRNDRPGDIHARRRRGVIERQWSRHDEGRGLSQAIADAASSEALGAAVLMARQPGTAEIGYWLIPRARGRGFGSRAVGLLARWAVSEAPLARIEALVVPDNTASQRVLEKAGFQREGPLRSYLVSARQRTDALISPPLKSDLS